jgi:catechol 2,3-dioxygenase-like lactoylglutathione lyase family enzyme
MSIGAFSLSLNVKDIKASRAFYENIGFSVVQGDIDDKWLIIKNASAVIGLFEGMLESNIMTFNPGWNNNAQAVDPFTDIRDLEKDFKGKGIPFISDTDGSESGPANFIIVDPDGNVILVDQHR